MKPRITYDQHTYRALSDARILERFQAKLDQRYGHPLPGQETPEEIYLNADAVREILSEVYRDLKNELK